MNSQIPLQRPLRTKPRAIIFDTDNTLYRYDIPHRKAMQAVENKAVEHIGIDRRHFARVLRQARDQTKNRLGPTASSHSRLLYLQRTIELLGLGTQIVLTLDLEQTYWRTFLSNCQLFPDVQQFLIDVKGDGITTAIITDMTAQIQFRKIVYFGLEHYFDYVVTSEEAGFDKPHDAPFDLALEKLNLVGDDIWMIGDSASADVRGAKRKGLLSLQKIHAGVISYDHGPEAAHIQFESFAELRTLWQSLPPRPRAVNS